MPLTSIEKIEFDTALKMVRMLVEQDAATDVLFEWKLGEHPSVTFTPVVPLEYVSAEFTVDKEKKWLKSPKSR